MRKILAVAVLALAAGGCVTTPRVWWKPGVTRAQMQADFRAAREAAYSSGRSDLAGPVDVWGNSRADLMIDREMMDRGYSSRPVYDAPFAGE